MSEGLHFHESRMKWDGFILWRELDYWQRRKNWLVSMPELIVDDELWECNLYIDMYCDFMAQNCEKIETDSIFVTIF